MEPFNFYHKTTKQVLEQVNAAVSPYSIVQRNGGQCAVFLGSQKVSAWANRGKAIDKAIELKKAES